MCSKAERIRRAGPRAPDGKVQIVRSSKSWRSFVPAPSASLTPRLPWSSLPFLEKCYGRFAGLETELTGIHKFLCRAHSLEELWN